jgi:hypothetical protein
LNSRGEKVSSKNEVDSRMSDSRMMLRNIMKKKRKIEKILRGNLRENLHQNPRNQNGKDDGPKRKEWKKMMMSNNLSLREYPIVKGGELTFSFYNRKIPDIFEKIYCDTKTFNGSKIPE